MDPRRPALSPTGVRLRRRGHSSRQLGQPPLRARQPQPLAATWFLRIVEERAGLSGHGLGFRQKVGHCDITALSPASSSVVSSSCSARSMPFRSDFLQLSRWSSNPGPLDRMQWHWSLDGTFVKINGNRGTALLAFADALPSVGALRKHAKRSTV
jgi:hypothetical protein